MPKPPLSQSGARQQSMTCGRWGAGGVGEAGVGGPGQACIEGPFRVARGSVQLDQGTPFGTHALEDNHAPPHELRIAVKADFHNAFNSVSREQTLKEFEAAFPNLAPWA